MARKPATIESTAVVVTDADTPALPAMREAANRLAVMHTEQEATVRAVAAQLGYQLPADCTDPDLIQRDIAANMRRSVEACLEVGRGLRVLKEACEHGQFTARLDVLGIEVRVAQKFMASAAKFSKAALTPLLKAAGNQTKLFEMLVLDDEQIEELELTGQTGELKLDDIATMSVKELRSALRETRENAEAQSRLLADKNTKIDQLDEQLAKAKKRVKALPPADVGEEIRKEVTAQVAQAEVSIRAMRAGLQALADHTDEHGIPHGEFMAGLVYQLDVTLRQLRDEFDIKAAPNGEEVPDWLRAGETVEA
ncbi:hypothetical protein [Burkholderia cepacia]|uniref:hypothetical protein n=1 Tax=Burkholderia cepacia TaxID=292 RepID=UPI0026E0B95C|nr:hypothetical protein [Burkholderia cepacia]MDO5940614.1 hypothetical protein [Burkholderia cepacia]